MGVGMHMSAGAHEVQKRASTSLNWSCNRHLRAACLGC